MFLQLKPNTFIFMDWVAYQRDQCGCSSPSTKGPHGWKRFTKVAPILFLLHKNKPCGKLQRKANEQFGEIWSLHWHLHRTYIELYIDFYIEPTFGIYIEPTLTSLHWFARIHFSSKQNFLEKSFYRVSLRRIMQSKKVLELAENTNWSGSITVQLTSCLFYLDSAALVTLN